MSESTNPTKYIPAPKPYGQGAGHLIMPDGTRITVPHNEDKLDVVGAIFREVVRAHDIAHARRIIDQEV